MKKSFHSSFWLMLAFFAFGAPQHLRAQAPNTIVFTANPFTDSLYSIDTTAGWTASAIQIDMAGFTVEGLTSIAWDPCEFRMYAIVKVTGGTRRLATLDHSTGTLTDIGDLGDNFSSLAFDDDCILHGTTGDGASTPETFYAINKTNASVTMLTALGNGDDGELISYNLWNNRFFHWSGNSTVIFEKFLPASPFTITPIASNDSITEIFGAVCIEPNRFLVSSINGEFIYMDTLGNVQNGIASGNISYRGLAIPPALNQSADTVCTGEIFSIDATGVFLYDVVYHWGDGDVTTVPGGSGTHAYSASGVYTVDVVLEYGSNADTFWTTTVTVEGIQPGLNPGDTSICAGGQIQFSAVAPNGSYQWYLNGAMIGGQTSSSINATSPGVYNVVFIDFGSGCSDSAATGSILSITPPPQAAFSFAPAVVTAGIPINFTNNSSNATSSLWDFGDGSGTSTVTNPSHTFATVGAFNVTLIVSNACGSDTSSQSLNVLTSIQDEFSPGLATLAPNPSTGLFIVQFSSKLDKAGFISVMNLQGMEVYALAEMPQGSESIQLNLQSLPDGIYLVKIEFAENTIFQRAVIQR